MTVKGRPMKPSEVVPLKATMLPPEVCDVINEMIAKHWDGDSAMVFQTDLANAMVAALGIPKAEVYARKYLDFEPVYREAGWIVSYDRPGYCETYDPSWTFKRRRTR